jgi:hypothetical protein
MLSCFAGFWPFLKMILSVSRLKKTWNLKTSFCTTLGCQPNHLFLFMTDLMMLTVAYIQRCHHLTLLGIDIKSELHNIWPRDCLAIWASYKNCVSQAMGLRLLSDTYKVTLVSCTTYTSERVWQLCKTCNAWTFHCHLMHSGTSRFQWGVHTLCGATIEAEGPTVGKEMYLSI